MIYIDEDDGTFLETGNYKINRDIVELTPANGEKSFYKIETGQIRRLDAEQKEITGTIADLYILKQSQSCN